MTPSKVRSFAVFGFRQVYTHPRPITLALPTRNIHHWHRTTCTSASNRFKLSDSIIWSPNRFLSSMSAGFTLALDHLGQSPLDPPLLHCVCLVPSLGHVDPKH